MLPATIILFSFYVAISDIRTHTISDKKNFLLLLLLLGDMNSLTLPHFLLAWLGLIGFCLLTHLGGGDFKLLSVLLATQGRILLSAKFGVGLSIALLLTFLVFLLIRRNLDGSVPMGPSILAPFAIGYLDI